MKSVFETIKTYHMIEKHMRVVAGVSGGADSVCLLYALKEYQKQVPFELFVVHVEHGIRGEASLEDAAYTQKLCRDMEIPCYVKSVDVQQIAKEEGLSVEEAGRIKRYEIFEEFCLQKNCDRIAVAHNQNDQAETVLWNLVRGSGLRGLGGIRPVRGKIIRPLLYTDRLHIEQILREAGIDWRTDSTNLQKDYTRNRIRLSVIPQMEQDLNGQAGLHLAQTAERMQQVQDYLDRVTEQAAKLCILKKEDSVELLLRPFLLQDSLIQKELIMFALEQIREGKGRKDISKVHVDMLLELICMDCGKECHIPGIRAVREDGRIRMDKRTVKLQKSQAEYLLEIPGQFEIENFLVTTCLLENDPQLQKEIIEEKKYTKWFSYDTITNDVCFRKRRTGDYLVINDAGGRKKLKDYLIDCKIPRDKRDDLWLLASGSHVLWIVGYRISSDAKVNQNTKKVCKIQLEEVLE